MKLGISFSIEIFFFFSFFQMQNLLTLCSRARHRLSTYRSSTRQRGLERLGRTGAAETTAAHGSRTGDFAHGKGGGLLILN